MWNFDLSKRTQPLGNFRFFSLSFPYYLIDCINRLYLVRANDFERLSSFTSSFGVVGGGRRLYIVFFKTTTYSFFCRSVKVAFERRRRRRKRETRARRRRRKALCFPIEKKSFCGVGERDKVLFFLRDYNYRVHVTEKRGFVQGRRFGGRGNDDFVRGAT